MELLIEHAEAENTIDQLRLTAKVKLCWDDLTAAHCVQSAATQSASSPIQLDFPQAQGAQMDACFPPGSLPTRPESDSPDPQLDPLLEPELRPQLEQQLETQLGPQLGQQLGPQLEQQLGPQRGQQLGPQLGQELGPQLGIVLSQQAKMLLQQMQTFGDLLKSRKLSLEKQTEGLCHLSETLDSLDVKAQIYYSVYLMRKLKKYQEQLYETPPPSFPVQPCVLVHSTNPPTVSS
ncbi:AT-hook-containing transcription factor-like [Gouania willdenowi]|uniref:AT-hook-containing transcription factor-like n=1 Tax=Gouania willdenowi TaxID=441366 RepID=UPI00105531F2|nr:AT-hook-containing transcription factor-like [Gouania willdenowi]